MRRQLAHRIGLCIVVLALAASAYIAFIKAGGGGFAQGPERRIEAAVSEAPGDLPALRADYACCGYYSILSFAREVRSMITI